MDDVNIIFALVLTAACAAGMMAATYHHMAVKKNWPTSAKLDLSQNGWVVIAGSIVLLAAIVTSVITNPWWAAPAVFAAAILLNALLIPLFKRHSRHIALPAVLLGAAGLAFVGYSSTNQPPVHYSVYDNINDRLYTSSNGFSRYRASIQCISRYNYRTN